MCCHSGGIVNRALKFGTPVQTLTLFESLLEHDHYISHQIQQHFVESIINIQEAMESFAFSDKIDGNKN